MRERAVPSTADLKVRTTTIADMSKELSYLEAANLPNAGKIVEALRRLAEY